MSEKKMTTMDYVLLAGGAYLVYAYFTESWPFNPAGPLATANQPTTVVPGALPTSQVTNSTATTTAASPSSGAIPVTITQSISGVYSYPGHLGNLAR
jgi:hypothetical protein